MKSLLIENILILCGGTLHGAAPGGEISAVTSDSRAVTPGCLFAAVRGGHDYIGAALDAGAACALAERVPEGVKGCVIVVPDTVAALQRLAGFYRAQFPVPLVGVTGSVGKTTAKEMTAAVLGRALRVHKTAGNYNNDLGVPLTLLGLREDHGAAVVELGVSHPGDMERIAAIARPTVALYTNIGDAHLEFLGDRAGVLAEKSVMNRYLPRDGVVLLNGDDPLLRTMDCPQRKLRYGLGPDCEVRAEEIQSLPDASTECVVAAEGRRFRVRIPAFGEHLVYAALGAVAAGLVLGLADEDIASGIGDYVPVGSRGRLLHSPSLTVIDDCYNANPSSTAAALRSLAKIPGRRVAILGDMLELGGRSGELHRATGALARELGLDLLLCAGPESEQTAAGAGDIARCFPDRAALIAALPNLLRPGDTVLVKASRSMRFEEITAALEAL
ncbi:MAG: UDP-N-acetylmuramoyl-tripeptide--D-alanyl-D-alanine ligase [Oscillospiraceae bacterium]|nr:UDP-N-acetylmuramoyl-tripeptide--D-alanyl-D-alanine ligase [Oscillospiraceae bacterium]